MLWQVPEPDQWLEIFTDYVAVFLLGVLAVSSLAVHAEPHAFKPYAPDTDMAVMSETLKETTSSSEGLSATLLSPMVDGTGMSTLDGSKGFEITKRCPHSPEFLSLLALPAATGDIETLVIKQDRDMDGTFDSSVSPGFPISGVCANGIMTCTPGTWSGCRSYQWQVMSDGSPGVVEVPLSKLGGCYCINLSCGESLMLKNAGEVLSHLGGGVVNTLIAHHPTLTVSGVRVDGTAIHYSGQLSDACGLEGKTGFDEYYTRPETLMPSAKTTSLSSGLFSKVTTGATAADTDARSRSCSIKRHISMDAAKAEEIILFDGGAGAVSRCGTGCVQLVLGTVGDDYWSGTCGLYEHEAKFWVEKPERILSAHLERAKFDDHIQVISDGALLWAHDAGWTNIADDSYPPGTVWPGGMGGTVPFCERSISWDVSPGVEFTSRLKTLGPHSFKIRVAVSDRGEGYAFARLKVDESCHLNPDTFTDTCAALAAEPTCDLEKETTDGVTTLSDFIPTGLSVLSITRELMTSACRKAVTRTWWEKERVYRCKTTPAFDLSGVAKRSEVIKTSASATKYDDYRLNPITGMMETVTDLKLELPSLPTMGSCEKTCKTISDIEGDEVAGMGAESAMRTLTRSSEFQYKKCQSGDVCPLLPGERVVSPCECTHFFGEATARMQAGRLAGKDLLCTSGEPSPL